MKNAAVILVWFLSISLCVSSLMCSASTQKVYSCLDSGPFFIQLLGEGKSYVSTWSFLQADLYYHGGVGHLPHDEHAIAQHNKHDETHDYEAHIKPWNILFRLNNHIHITKHKHLESADFKEFLPWLYYSAEIDPHNVQAITITAYYVADIFKKPEEAINYLRKGLKQNPDSWEIYAEMGMTYFRFLNNPSRAVIFLTHAEQLILKNKHTKYQERSILTFLGASYLQLGQNEKAISVYNRLLELFPNEKAFKVKLDSLTQNQ